MTRRLRPGSPGFTALLGALTALPPLPGLAASLDAAPEATAATLSAFMAGFALAQLVHDPASDRFGRRPVLLPGLLIYTDAGLACTLAPSLHCRRRWRGGPCRGPGRAPAWC